MLSFGASGFGGSARLPHHPIRQRIRLGSVKSAEMCLKNSVAGTSACGIAVPEIASSANTSWANLCDSTVGNMTGDVESLVGGVGDPKLDRPRCLYELDRTDAAGDKSDASASKGVGLGDSDVATKSKVYIPFPRPSSIRLLARLPLMPELLRLLPSALLFRISLFRRMTGVSAKGSAMRMIFSSSSPPFAPRLRFFSIVIGLAFSGLGDRSTFACDFACAAL